MVHYLCDSRKNDEIAKTFSKSMDDVTLFLLNYHLFSSFAEDIFYFRLRGYLYIRLQYLTNLAPLSHGITLRLHLLEYLKHHLPC